MKRLFALVLASGIASTASAADLTIYNSDLALIREIRRMKFEAGQGTVKLGGVPSRIDPSSARLSAEGVSVLEQSFANDLADPNRLLDRYIGREVEFERYDGGKRESVKGTLLSVEGGRVLRSGGRVLIDPPGAPVLPDLPEGTSLEPTLLWKVSSKNAGERNAEVTYLTGGLSWTADYVLELSAKEDRLDLDAWATISNETGSDFSEARIKLVAGDINRVAPAAAPAAMRMMAKSMTFAEDAANVEPQAFSEYHLYDLPRPVTLERRQSKQVSLAQAGGVPVKKIHVFDAQSNVYSAMNEYTRSDPNYGLGGDSAIYSILDFTNNTDSGLGNALPRGRVRVYKADSKGALQLAGEDTLNHTARNEKVRIRLGRVFDMTGERKRMNVVSEKRATEETFEISITNRKDEAAAVTITERLSRWNTWKIIASSKPYRKKDAQTIEFDVAVPADGATTVSYTVRYTW